MIKPSLLAVLFLVYGYSVYSQTVADVLENGIHVKKDHKLVFKYEKGALLYDDALSLVDPTHPPDYTPLEDSTIFLASKDAINVYLSPPLNPLNFTVSTEIKSIPDPIDASADAALGSIIDVLAMVRAPAPHAAPVVLCDTLFAHIKSKVQDIEDRLDDNKKTEINAAFKLMKSLSFKDERITTDSIALIKITLDNIGAYFEATKTLIEQTQAKVRAYTCGTPDVAFTVRYILTNILKEAAEKNAEQRKRIDNAMRAYTLVNSAKNRATTTETGLKWCVELPKAPVKKGKIHLYTIDIKKSGLKLSDKDEIVAEEEKSVLKRTIRTRKFYRFVLEVAPGIAYTNFKYYTYGITTDSLDKPTERQHVASPTENLIRNINLSTTVNFNYYITDSPVHPFYQLGAGINSGIPTLLTGFGLRSNLNGLRRISISYGWAWTWIKELDELKVGDVVSGTAEIEKDLIYRFTKPSCYLGIQYNF